MEAIDNQKARKALPLGEGSGGAFPSVELEGSRSGGASLSPAELEEERRQINVRRARERRKEMEWEAREKKKRKNRDIRSEFYTSNRYKTSPRDPMPMTWADKKARKKEKERKADEAETE